MLKSAGGSIYVSMVSRRMLGWSSICEHALEHKTKSKVLEAAYLNEHGKQNIATRSEDERILLSMNRISTEMVVGRLGVSNHYKEWRQQSM
jgi:hypothetical protein